MAQRAPRLQMALRVWPDARAPAPWSGCGEGPPPRRASVLPGPPMALSLSSRTGDSEGRCLARGAPQPPRGREPGRSGARRLLTRKGRSPPADTPRGASLCSRRYRNPPSAGARPAAVPALGVSSLPGSLRESLKSPLPPRVASLPGGGREEATLSPSCCAPPPAALPCLAQRCGQGACEQPSPSAAQGAALRSRSRRPSGSLRERRPSSGSGPSRPAARAHLGTRARATTAARLLLGARSRCLRSPLARHLWLSQPGRPLRQAGGELLSFPTHAGGGNLRE